MKEYLGDGVYAEYLAEMDRIRLSTENGVRETNHIFLEADVWEALKSFAKRSMEL
jgi:hypothetical protein